ncbi:MAG: hypothetical protein KAT56_11370, partial [Sedimentisphaerales bacterium]|nr:hypothetical protein [Sedimentisphaerales bacterium]
RNDGFNRFPNRARNDKGGLHILLQCGIKVRIQNTEYRIQNSEFRRQKTEEKKREEMEHG